MFGQRRPDKTNDTARTRRCQSRHGVKRSGVMILIAMGVSGSGKTTIGEQLAARLNCGFADADEFHSEANRRRCTRAIP